MALGLDQHTLLPFMLLYWPSLQQYPFLGSLPETSSVQSTRSHSSSST